MASVSSPWTTPEACRARSPSWSTAVLTPPLGSSERQHRSSPETLLADVSDEHRVVGGDRDGRAGQQSLHAPAMVGRRTGNVKLPTNCLFPAITTCNSRQARLRHQ
jgi:hypothetical protein